MAKGIKGLIIQGAAKVFPTRFKHLLFHFSLATMDEREQARLRRLYSMTTLKWALQNLSRIGKRLDHVIDVGAYEGEWTGEVLSVFPEAQVLMVEGQPAKEPILKRVEALHPGRVQHAITLVGGQERADVEFYEMETGSSVLYEQCNADRRKVLRTMTTIDRLMIERAFPKVDLLKIDVQGYELEVLRGASETLKKTELVLLEVSLLPIIKGAPLMPEVIAFMNERGFLPYEICSLMRRPLDQSLWQMDLLFVRATSDLLANKTKGD